jgi:single-strand DNA-binding protein
MRATPSGQMVTNFSVAVNNSWTDTSTGELHEMTTWYRVSVWGKQAETCNQYLSKGRKVLVEGKLNADKETGGPRVAGSGGKWRASYEINAFDVSLWTAANGNGNGRAAGVEMKSKVDEIPF